MWNIDRQYCFIAPWMRGWLGFLLAVMAITGIELDNSWLDAVAFEALLAPVKNKSKIVHILSLLINNYYLPNLIVCLICTWQNLLNGWFIPLFDCFLKICSMPNLMAGLRACHLAKLHYFVNNVTFYLYKWSINQEKNWNEA